MDIDGLRKRIDELDQQLVKLLNERAQCAHAIGRLKRGQQMPIYEPKREQVIFENVRQHNDGPLDDRHLVQIYERIIDIMRTIQREEITTEAPTPHSTEFEDND